MLLVGTRTYESLPTYFTPEHIKEKIDDLEITKYVECQVSNKVREMREMLKGVLVFKVHFQHQIKALFIEIIALALGRMKEKSKCCICQ
jgi:hypothetical protein